MRKLIVVILATAISSVLLASCSGDGEETTGGAPTATGTGTGTGGGGGTDVSGMTLFQLTAVDFSFAPDALQGTAGQALTITVQNDGEAPHTFTIDEQEVDTEVAPGESADVDVTFPESGSVTFYCAFHEGSGMVGELTVA